MSCRFTVIVDTEKKSTEHQFDTIKLAKQFAISATKIKGNETCGVMVKDEWTEFFRYKHLQVDGKITYSNISV